MDVVKETKQLTSILVAIFHSIRIMSASSEEMPVNTRIQRELFGWYAKHGTTRNNCVFRKSLRARVASADAHRLTRKHVFLFQLQPNNTQILIHHKYARACGAVRVSRVFLGSYYIENSFQILCAELICICDTSTPLLRLLLLLPQLLCPCPDGGAEPNPKHTTLCL